MNSILLAGQKVTRRFQRDGLAASFRYLTRRLKQICHHTFYDSKFDRLERHPSGTQRWVKSDEIVGQVATTQVNYDAYPRLPLLWSLSTLGIDPKDFTFVDFGSGRGRLILAAALLPFKQCIGVEFSRTLHAEARENIAKYPRERLVCRENVSLNLDARDFELPRGNIVAFFFNPFLGAILDQVAKNLEKAARASDRAIYVIFANTTGVNLFPGRRAFRRVYPRGIARLKLALFGTIPLEFYRVDRH
jgi:hypothetical protein